MSNVLIGIIGVILFIGLALAGALILGDDFRSSSNSSQAAAVVSQLQQVQSAVEMWRLKTGFARAPMGTTEFLTPRFLKTAATNPSRAARGKEGQYLWSVHLNNDACADPNNEGSGAPATIVMMPVGYGEDDSGVCRAIGEMMPGGTIQHDSWSGSVGCARLVTGCGILPQPIYVAFARI